MHHLLHVQFRGIRRERTARETSPCASPPAPVNGLLASYVLAKAGLDPVLYRAVPLERRIPACLRALGAASEAEAVARIEDEPALQQTALGTLLIGVSEFFRDPPVFETLRAAIVPGLLRPRVASVGCATGAELYSVAILLAEAGLLDEAELLGTDCRADAIDAARAGMFSPAELTNVGPARMARYFERTSSGFRVARVLRDRTTWIAGDVTQALIAGPLDLVLCRNLTIYLQAGAAERLVKALTAALVPGGVLVVGKAERPPASFGLTQVARCVYRRAHE
jgi:chemotaxis protein methyltransferase CheR